MLEAKSQNRLINTSASPLSFVDASVPDSPGSPRCDSRPSCVIISGGTGGNQILDAFVRTCSEICNVLPISDNGGSSSEIIRVLGGPSLGDIRSRLIRLIPPRSRKSPSEAIKRLLSYRLSSKEAPDVVKRTWLDIVEGQHPLWNGIPVERRESIRAFLVYFESEILKRSMRKFDFRSGSVGNFFFAGALSFFRNIESAIFMFGTLCGVPEHHRVLPCINTNSVATIAADLESGETLIGQNQISHPSTEHQTSTSTFEGNLGLNLGDDDALGHRTPSEGQERGEDLSNLIFDKQGSEQNRLPSPIHRVYYINSFGKHVYPRANPRYLDALRSSEMLVYACGSLYTSIVPCLAIRGVGKAIATSPSLKYKILLLNSIPDRETPKGTTATSFVNAITTCLNDNMEDATDTFNANSYITHLVYLSRTAIPVDEQAIELSGIKPIQVVSDDNLYDDSLVESALQFILNS